MDTTTEPFGGEDPLKIASASEINENEDIEKKEVNEKEENINYIMNKSVKRPRRYSDYYKGEL